MKLFSLKYSNEPLISGGALIKTFCPYDKTGHLVYHIPMEKKFTNLEKKSFLQSSVVRQLLGYSNRAAFWDAVRRAGIPYIKINARRHIFDAAEVEAWLERRKIGGKR